MFPFALLTGVAVAALLAAEYRNLRPGVWVAKPLAATAFVAAALSLGALGSRYGRWLLFALVLSWLGDLLLIPRAARRFLQAGIVSFLFAHVAFALAFAVRGMAPSGAFIALGALVVPYGLTLRWLRPHVPPGMRFPVYAYMTVISGMVACAAGTVASEGGVAILVGALMFYLSDLFVARERFVTPSFWNRGWGLPLYFGAQLTLASTVA